MAENQWGKSPPKGKFSYARYDQREFWGPAEVPDQVRGTPRVTVWGGPRPWEEGERPDSIPPGMHDTWVSGEAKKRKRCSPSLKERIWIFLEAHMKLEGIEPAEADSNKPTVREQGPGEHDSWVGGEAKKGTMQSEFEEQILNSQEASILQKASNPERQIQTSPQYESKSQESMILG